MEVKIHKGGEWYVYIYHDNRIIKKFYKGLNKAESDDERELKAKALKLAIENELKNGWNWDRWFTVPNNGNPDKTSYLWVGVLILVGIFAWDFFRKKKNKSE